MLVLVEDSAESVSSVDLQLRYVSWVRLRLTGSRAIQAHRGDTSDELGPGELSGGLDGPGRHRSPPGGHVAATQPPSSDSPAAPPGLVRNHLLTHV
jgi:hypothetical protein